MVEYISPAPAVFQASSPVVEHTAPAPTVFQASSSVEEYIAPAPAVFQASSPVVKSVAPVPAVFQASSPVEEYIAPEPAVFQAPTPVVEVIAPVPAVFHAPVFPLSLDASDTSSPEDMYTSSWVSLPVPTKLVLRDVSVEAEGQACETPTVMHGRGLPAVSRDRVASSQWHRKEAARQGLPGGSGGVHSSFARYVQHACLLVVWLVARPCGVLVETLRKLATRGKRTSTSGKSSGQGAGATVAVIFVLEDHATAILELERQVPEVDCLVNHVKNLEQLLAQLQDIAFKTRDRSLSRLPNLA